MNESLRSLAKQAITDGDGAISMTRIWESVCYATCTFIVIWLCVVDKISAEYLLIYIGALATRGSINKALEERYKNKDSV